MFQRWLIVNDVGYLGNWDMYSRFINITLSKENMCKRYDVGTFVYFRILCSERLASQRLAPVRFDQLSFNFIDKRSERLIVTLVFTLNAFSPCHFTISYIGQVFVKYSGSTALQISASAV